MSVRQLRVVVETDNYEDAVHCYRDVLGLPEEHRMTGPWHLSPRRLPTGGALSGSAAKARIELVAVRALRRSSRRQRTHYRRLYSRVSMAAASRSRSM